MSDVPSTDRIGDVQVCDSRQRNPNEVQKPTDQLDVGIGHNEEGCPISHLLEGR